MNSLFATHLQKDLNLSPALVATPIFFANLGVFLATCAWGWWSDRFGRRSAIIIPALVALPLAPLYLLSSNFLWIAVGFVAQGVCAGGGMQGQMVPYLNERFPPEIRATAVAFAIFVYHVLGDVPSPALIGKISDATGNLTLALLSTSFMMAVSGILYLRGARTLAEDTHAVDWAVAALGAPS